MRLELGGEHRTFGLETLTLSDELLQLKQRAAPWGFGLAVNGITASAP